VLVDDALVELVSRGSAHVVGLTGVAGEPFATRGWGAVIDPGGPSGRVMIAGEDVDDLEQLDSPTDRLVGTTIALTAGDVRTFRTVQLKGPILGFEPCTPDDLAAAELYRETYFDAVMDVDFFARAMLERMIPATLVTVRFDVTATFDQTPGPGAGRDYGSPI
jgi:hypothetical protein